MSFSGLKKTFLQAMPVGAMEASNFKLFLPLNKRPANYATALGLSQSPLVRNLRRNLRNLSHFFFRTLAKIGINHFENT